ncbi:MAG: glycoside hydrolase domain-containing protein, partial [Chthoniobacterales bacterium]
MSLRGETVVLDGMEGERVNPLIASATDVAGGSSYSLAVNGGSPFASSTFGTSRVSGWLNDLGLGKGPSLVRAWAASADESTFLQFDVRPDSGDYGKWGFYLQNSSAKAVSLFLRDGSLQVRGKTAPGLPSTYIPVPNVPLIAGQWYHVSIAVRPPSSSDRSYAITVTDSIGRKGTLNKVYFDIDTTSAIGQLSIWPGIISPASLHIDNVLLTKSAGPEFRYGYFPTENRLRFYAATPTLAFTNWTVTLQKHGAVASPLASQSGKFPFTLSAAEMSIPALTDGDYDVTLALSNPATGAGTQVVRTFKHKTPPWQNNSFGTNPVVVPPFTPLTVDLAQGTVNCLLRSYKTGASGLWDQVTSQGTPLLAAPMELKVTVAGATSTATGTGIIYSRKADHEVIASTRWNAGSVNGSTNVQYEYDGMMKVTLNVDPTTTPISDLSLVIPLQNAAMTNDARGLLMHAVTDGIRKNPVGRVPAGTGVVWNSSAIQRNESIGPFVPYIWLGGPERGICWFADNDKDWIVDPAKAELEITRNGGQTSLVVHFINTPSTVNRQRTIVFGLMATPAKPMPEPSFRKWSFGPSSADGDYPLGLISSSMARGSVSKHSSFYPAFRNYSFYTEMAAARRTGSPAGRSFLEAWIAQPQFTAPAFTAAWKRDYVDALQTSFDDLAQDWPDHYVLKDVIVDGMEGNRLNHMSVDTPPGSSYTFTLTDPSPFVVRGFGWSRASGLLVNQSKTNLPVLKRDGFAVKPRNWLKAQFDFKPVSGRWDEWGFWIGRTETNTYAAMMKVQDNAFWIYGRSAPGAPCGWTAVPNIVVEPAKWYHIEFLVSPTSRNPDKTVS